jgi:hypothetical protein
MSDDVFHPGAPLGGFMQSGAERELGEGGLANYAGSIPSPLDYDRIEFGNDSQ